jgi:hypothetical protein
MRCGAQGRNIGLRALERAARRLSLHLDSDVVVNPGRPSEALFCFTWMLSFPSCVCGGGELCWRLYQPMNRT